MTATLEQISAALFALAQTIPGVETTSRKPRLSSDVAPAEQPALFQLRDDVEVPRPAAAAGGRSIAGPTQSLIPFTWLLYVHASTMTAELLETAVNDLVEGAFTALRPGPGQMNQTLGGLVADCRIAGTIQTDGGMLGEQGVAMIPIEVTAFLR